jgi:alanine-synthesizing transaminase
VSGGQDNLYKCDKDWVADPADIRKKINRRTRAIVVINPNNPTGAVYPEKVLREIVGIAGEHNLPIIADEIYDRMALDDDAKMVNMRTLTKDVPLISGNGISKNFIYPGARVGYLAFHGEGLDRIRETVMKLCNARLSVNWEMQRGALAAFTMPASHLAEVRKKLRERRDITHRMLNEIDGIRLVKPRAAFYAFAEVTSPNFKDDREFCYSLLERTGVLVVPGSSFSSELNGKFFRLVYLPKPEILKDAIGKIAEFVRTA